MTKPTRPVLRYYGGKWRLSRKLIELFPPHHVYTEGFGGAASVLMMKDRSPAEIYNDLDGEVVNVFRVLQVQAHARRLEKLLRVTPFAREEFEKSYKPSGDVVERARRTIMRSFMGFGSDSITRVKASDTGFNTRISTMRTGFRSNSWRSNTPAAVDWARYPDNLETFCDRMRGVVIENRDALEVMAKADRIDTLHYVDPPYPKSTRNNGATDSRVEHNYRHEMDDAQHERLAELLHSLKGMVMISSYPSPLYRRLYADWESIEWTGQQFCHASQKRTEVVWLNSAAYLGSPIKRLW
jgi:DNA adenine methylase